MGKTKEYVRELESYKDLCKRCKEVENKGLYLEKNGIVRNKVRYCWKNTIGFLGGRGTKSKESILTPLWFLTNLIGHYSGLLWVAGIRSYCLMQRDKGESECIGTISICYWGKGRFCISDVCIIPSERGKGYGKDMLHLIYKEVTDIHFRRGYKEKPSVVLKVRENNERGKRLYVGDGFIPKI